MYNSQFRGFGSGLDGNLSYGGGNMGGLAGFGLATFIGTAGNNYGTFSDVGYFNGSNGGRIGDICLIHQSRGTGAGQWELAKIINRSGTTVYFDRTLTYSYTTGAQIQSSGNWKNGTISGATSQYVSWGGSTGGIVFLICNGILTVSSSISVVGGNGSYFVSQNGRGGGATGGGFYGGNGFNPSDTNDAYGNTGEGTAGASYVGLSANGNGGGGGHTGGDWGAGSGGGNGTAGTAGANNNGTDSVGGGTAGNSALTNMVFGGGGGGSVKGYSYTISGGGAGGGIILLIAKEIIVNGSLSVKGGNGGGDSSVAIGGGAGAGGSILLKCQKGTLGTNLLTASAGNAGIGSQSYGGAGGNGRIHIDYLTSYTGSAGVGIDATQANYLSDDLFGGMI